MSTASLPILYSFRRCPYAMRARMALFASGQAYVLREVVLRDKPPQMLALSAKGTVPVLVLSDGRVIDESLDVMRWALARNDPHGWLDAPADQTNALIARCDTDFKTHLDRYKYASRYDGGDPLAHRTAGIQFIQQLEDRLSATAYLFGARRSLADIAIAPFVRQFALADWDWFFAAPYPHVHRWLNNFIASDLFVGVMAKFDPWRPGDTEIIITPGT
ncbi:glutathione S-transferase [Magnetovibrio sp.]|uniref:glutathione S-transferase n=1 Tax=Magnetovibrio sp. TaxID=2024836 RepID=UPI002F959B8B